MKIKIYKKIISVCLAITVACGGLINFFDVSYAENNPTTLPITVMDSKIIGVGQYHTVVLKNDGTVWSWGLNDVGQLGDGTNVNKMNPVQVKGLTDVVSVYADNNHSVALKSDGTVWAWGANNGGQLGNQSKKNSNVPVKVFGLSNIVSVKAGSGNNLALQSDGTVWAWGGNGDNQFGDGYTNTSIASPVIVQVDNVVKLGGAGNFTMLLKSDGTVWGAGNNQSGQMGNGTIIGKVMKHTMVPELTNVVDIWTGVNHSFALKSDGTLWAWGWNSNGQLGDQTTETKPSPIQIYGIDNIQSIQGGMHYTTILKKDGTLWGIGSNTKGQLGEGIGPQVNKLTPVFIMDDVVGAASNFYRTQFVKSDGSVWGLGWNNYGQIGDGTKVDKTVPTQALNISDIGAPPLVDQHPPLISITLSEELPTNQNIIVTAIVTDENGVSNKKWAKEQRDKSYFLSNGNEINGDTFTVSENGIYTIWAIDANGNEAVEYFTVSNIDKTKPTAPLASVSGNQLTIVPGTDASGIRSTQYQLNSGAWTMYSGIVSLPDGIYTINVKSIDSVGNESLITTIVANVFVEALGKATLAVESAEASPSQEKVDTAQDLVTALPTSIAKTDLQNRLEKVKSDINLYHAIQAEIDSMNTVVNKGNISKVVVTQYKQRVEQLYVSVNALSNAMDKAGLKIQLDELKGKLHLIESLLNANNDGNFEDVDLGGIEDEINQLPDGELKDDLQNQLDKAKDLQNAIDKVENAENTIKQEDVDIARDAVNKLPDGQIKDDLNDRLDQIQKEIDEEKALEDLIANATQKVVIAEGSKKQSDVDTARDAVNKLPNGAVKDDLNKRLDAIQKEIDDAKALEDLIANATAKVVIAEGSKKQSDVDTARDAVNKLPNGAVKDDLNKRLDAIQKEIDEAKALEELIDNATQKVVVAEGSKKQSDVDTAKDAVNKLPNGAVKDDLNKRLDAIQKEIDDAKALADLIADATTKVVIAEGSKKQVDVDTARDAVNKLPNGKVKDDLNKRLDAIQKEIDDANENPFETAVKKAEKSKAQVDVNSARDLVNTLPDGSEKDVYHKRLDAVDAALKAATTKVGQAETYLRDPYLSDSQKLVDGLIDSPAKIVLQERIDAVHIAIAEKAYQDLLAKAIQKVEQAEKYKRDPYIKDAYTAVNLLPNGEDKTLLLDRLEVIINGNGSDQPGNGNDQDGNFKPGDDVMDVINSIKDPVAKKAFLDWGNAIVRAEKYFSRANIEVAINKMNAIMSDIKDNPKYIALYEELKKKSDMLKETYNQMTMDKNLERDINASINAIELYERYQSALFKGKAQIAVDKLPSGSVKEMLQARIDAVIEK